MTRSEKGSVCFILTVNPLDVKNNTRKKHHRKLYDCKQDLRLLWWHVYWALSGQLLSPLHEPGRVSSASGSARPGRRDSRSFRDPPGPEKQNTKQKKNKALEQILFFGVWVKRAAAFAQLLSQILSPNTSCMLGSMGKSICGYIWMLF